MLKFAGQMNLSETAFARAGVRSGEYSLRWFTPAVEVDLCGHATVATAYALWNSGRADRGRPILFQTRKHGLLPVQLDQEDDRVWLDFPQLGLAQHEPPSGLCEALGVMASQVKFVGFTATFAFFVELDSAETVKALAPSMAAVAKLPCRSVVVSAAGGERTDYVLRYFAPAQGIDEDPVTGSAQCYLGPYWARALNKTSLVSHQLSKRGGEILVRVNSERVKLGGRARVVTEGRLV